MDREVQQDHLRFLVHKNILSADELDRALTIAGFIPGGKAWAGFLNTLFLLLGSILLAAGVVFFFAYNWAAMPTFLKFGVVQAVLLAAVFTASYLGFDTLGNKASLLAAAILTGALLALFGQTYQTGADAYELFLGWSALIAGWVVIGNFAPLWLLLLILLEAVVYLYWGQVVEASWFIFRSPLLYEILFAMNAAALAGWELLSLRNVSWATGRWIPRTVLSLGFLSLVLPLIIMILDSHAFPGDPSAAVFLPLLYIAAAGLTFWFYESRMFDLFMIAAVLLSAIVLVSVLFGKAIGDNFGGFLLLSMLIVGMSAAAAAWMHHLSRSHKPEAL
jgi:uncharacterized membrane protein